MSFIQERIAELEAAIAKLESQPAQSDPNIIVSLPLLRAELIKLRGGFHSSVADPSLESERKLVTKRIQPVVEQYGTPSQRRDIVDSLNLINMRRYRFYMLPDETVDRIRKLLAASRETADLSEIAFYQFSLGFVHMWREELDEAKQELGISLSLATRIGDVAQQTKCLTYLTLSHRKANQVQEVEDYASQSLALAKASQNSAYTGWALANLGWVAWRNGNFERARGRPVPRWSYGRRMPPGDRRRCGHC